MADQFVLLKGKPGMSREDMHAHWSGTHTEIALRLPEYCAYTSRYIQNYLEPSTIAFSSDSYFGVVELTPTRDKDVRAAFDRAYRQKLRPDEYNCLDVDNCVALYAARRLAMLEPSHTGVNTFSCIRRTADIARGDHRDYA